MRYKITLEYDGTNLLGWQKQLDGPSVQEYLEDALRGFAKDNLPEISLNIKKEDVSTGKLLPSSNKTLIQGAGRTDTGVHALAQVAHFDLKKGMNPFRIREAFNAHLKLENAPVAVLEVEETSDDFHSRFSAVGRGYIYRILNRRSPSALLKDRVWWVPVPLNIENMRHGAKYLIGHHDFSSFRAAACQALSPMKTLDKINIISQGEEIIFEVEARSFLHHQVRNMVGTLKMIGDGHLQAEDIKMILGAKNRCAGGVTAPASGLYLSKVMY